MAKIHNVEVSTRAGQVDAAKLAQLQRKGVPLTGGLKIIADTAENFPNITRHSTKLAGLGGIAMPTTAAAFAHKVIGTVAGKLPGVSVATDRFQNRFGNVVSPERASYHAKRKATKKGTSAAAPATGHSHGNEAIARLIKLSRHPVDAVSAAASRELLEMLMGRPLRIPADRP